MSITLDLDAEQLRRLEERARTLGVEPTELVKKALDQLLARPAPNLEQVADYLLEKNRELYRRLAQ